MKKDEFVGTWRLVDAEIGTSTDANTPGQSLYGADVVGYLTYSNDGYISVHIGNANLPTSGYFAGLMKVLKLAGSTYFSYLGKYEIGKDRVVHYIEVSSHPNYFSDRQEYLFELNGDRLTLIQELPLGKNKKVIMRRNWEKQKLEVSFKE